MITCRDVFYLSGEVSCQLKINHFTTLFSSVTECYNKITQSGFISTGVAVSSECDKFIHLISPFDSENVFTGMPDDKNKRANISTSGITCRVIRDVFK